MNGNRRARAWVGQWARGCAIVAALTGPSCAKKAPEPRGEAVVVVDVDVSVPRFVGRLRVDLFEEHGTWFESRDYAAPAREAWPLSFSIFNDDDTKERFVAVRLRAFPEGRQRDYRGERFQPKPGHSEPKTAQNIVELCSDPPTLAFGSALTLRRGPNKLTDIVDVVSSPVPGDAGGDGGGETSPTYVCQNPVPGSGSVAVKIIVSVPGTYRFEVTHADPNGALGDADGDSILVLRKTCDVSASQLACGDDIDGTGGNYLSRIVTRLDPGIYYLVTSGRYPSPADLTLQADFADRFTSVPSGPAPSGASSSGAPRLVVDGQDVTPEVEPEPGVTIDRFFKLKIHPGERGTVHVALTGECLGTMADIDHLQSCVNREGELRPIELLTPVEGVDHGGPSLAGTWSAEGAVACTGVARVARKTRDGMELLDDDVCIAGGAFTFGDPRSVDVGRVGSVPERIAVMSPFFIDRYEVTVGRYRDAVKSGFKAPYSPVVNDGPIVTKGSNDCTMTTTASSLEDREKYPLTCVDWFTARAFCQFIGGDLPTEAQWEYAAGAAGVPFERIFPWGSETPSCDHMAFGRSDSTLAYCNESYGPVEVDALPWAAPGHDVASTGIVGMGGNVTEWVRDGLNDLNADIWRANGTHDPAAWDGSAPVRSARGTSWNRDPLYARTFNRFGFAPYRFGSDVGFRCARSGDAR